MSSLSYTSSFLITVSCPFGLLCVWNQVTEESKWLEEYNSFSETELEDKTKSIYFCKLFYTFNFLFYLGSSSWPFQVTMQKLKKPNFLFVKW